MEMYFYYHAQYLEDQNDLSNFSRNSNTKFYHVILRSESALSYLHSVHMRHVKHNMGVVQMKPSRRLLWAKD